MILEYYLWINAACVNTTYDLNTDAATDQTS